jgi:hypothetical protein
MPGWQSFTKAEPAEPMPAGAKTRKSLQGHHSLKRLAKSEAETLRGMMRTGDC